MAKRKKFKTSRPKGQVKKSRKRAKKERLKMKRKAEIESMRGRYSTC